MRHIKSKGNGDALELKKLTLAAWAKVLLVKGMIDVPKYAQMERKIEKLSQ